MAITLGSALLGGAATASAVTMTSPSYRIDDSAINSFGGDASSTNYRLTDSGGEAFIGPGSSETYRFNAGYVASLEHSLTITLNALSVSFTSLVPGTSQTATTNVGVFTDAAGYLLTARQDKPLTHTNGSTTIANIASSIASPALWSEGTTKGFGFSLTSGSSIESKWGSSPNYKYAAFPTSDTTVHDKPLYQNTTDTTVVQYRLDIDPTQLAGTYTDSVTFNATIKP
jgi:hypothetical protein